MRLCLLARHVAQVRDQLVLHENPCAADLRTRQRAIAGKVKRGAAVDLKEVGSFIDVVCLQRSKWAD